jgi:hypothetical protein
MSKKQVVRRLPEVGLIAGFTFGWCFGYTIDQWPWTFILLPLAAFRLWQWARVFKKIADAEEKSR